MDVREGIINLLSQIDGHRPFVLCIAGPNGAGKSTLYPELICADIGHIYLNADVVSKDIQGDSTGMEQMKADILAQQIIRDTRKILLSQEQSFVFETVFSHHSKVEELQLAREHGYVVLLIFVALESIELSKHRVKRRVEFDKGHFVPEQKLETRFPNTLTNLASMVHIANGLLVLDNSAEDYPFQVVAFGDSTETLTGPDFLQPLWVKLQDLPSAK